MQKIKASYLRGVISLPELKKPDPVSSKLNHIVSEINLLRERDLL